MTIEKRYNRRQVAEMLGCHVRTIDRNVIEGKFPPPEKVLGRPSWRESVIVKYLESRKNK